MSLQTQDQANAVFQQLQTLRKFMSTSQVKVLRGAINGEEADHFIEKIGEYAERFETMHHTYQQDGKGDEAIVHLHYFRGGMDWFITEKDMEAEQHQAFGLANLGYGGELGYISIEELKANDIELDLFWEPKPLKECR